MVVQSSSISNFKRFIVAVLVPWLVIVISFGLVAAWLFERYVVLGSEISGAYKVNRIITGAPPKEIPILGSSRVEGGFIPNILGSNFFNYGMAGAQDNVSIFLLEKACLRPGITPILLNIDLDGLNNGIGDVRNYILNANDPGVKKLLGKEYKAHYAFPVVKYYGAFEVYSKYFLNSKLNLTRYTNKGASIEKNALPRDKFQELVNKTQNDSVTFENDTILEKKLFQIIRKHPKRTIVILSAPYHMAAVRAFTNFPAAKAFLTRLDLEPNVQVIDCSQMDFPDDHFFDLLHLNYLGAQAFSRAVRDSLQQL